jgi:hypothetical protein
MRARRTKDGDVMMGSTFVRRLYWRALWLVGIHSLGLWMLPDATERDLRQDGLAKPTCDASHRD